MNKNNEIKLYLTEENIKEYFSEDFIFFWEQSKSNLGKKAYLVLNSNNHPLAKILAYASRYEGKYHVHLSEKILGLGEESVKAIIAHELAHIHNGDLDPKEEPQIIFPITLLLIMIILKMTVFFYIAMIISLIIYFLITDTLESQRKEFLADKVALKFVSKEQYIKMLNHMIQEYPDKKYLSLIGSHSSLSKRKAKIMEEQI